jgi:hypothetical protein
MSSPTETLYFMGAPIIRQRQQLTKSTQTHHVGVLKWQFFVKVQCIVNFISLSSRVAQAVGVYFLSVFGIYVPRRKSKYKVKSVRRLRVI